MSVGKKTPPKLVTYYVNGTPKMVAEGDALILEAIDALRHRKARPDEARIIHWVQRRRTDKRTPDIARLLHVAVRNGSVLRVHYKESISYRNAFKTAAGAGSGKRLPPLPLEPGEEEDGPVPVDQHQALLDEIDAGHQFSCLDATSGTLLPMTQRNGNHTSNNDEGMEEYEANEWSSLASNTTASELLRLPGDEEDAADMLFEKLCQTKKGIQLDDILEQRESNPEKWSIDEVHSVIHSLGFPTEAATFKREEVDGHSLLLLTRSDILKRLSFKLGPALKIHAHIKRLQTHSCFH